MRKILYICLALLLVSSVVSADSIKVREGMRKMEKATVERVDISTVDVRLHGKYIANVELVTSVDIEMVGLRDVVLVEEVSGKYYLVAIISAGPAGASERLAEWVPRAPVSLTQTQLGSVFTLSWDWGDSTRMLAYLGNYVVDFKVAGGEWGTGQFPLDVGAAKTTTVDLSDYGDTGFEWRVMAVSIYGTSSGWAETTVDFVVDIEAPPAPDGFEAFSGVEEIRFLWDGLSVEEVPDLAGYKIYRATDVNGTDAALYVSVGLVSTVFIPESPGADGYFNIKAYDSSGNESVYALSTGSWDYAIAAHRGSGQILTNADWEVADVATDDVHDWNYYANATVGTPTLDFGSGNGVYGGNSTIVVSTVDGDFYIQQMSWPDPITAVKVPGVEDGNYVVSVYVRHVSGGGDPPPGLYANLGSHDGSAGLVWIGSKTWDGYVELDNDWCRVWWNFKWNAHDSNHLYLAFRVSLADQGYPAATIYMDRPQLELGLMMTVWTLNPAYTGNMDGLRLDTSGIVGDSIVIDQDGKIASDLVSDDETRDIGLDAERWDNAWFAGNIDVEGNIIVDGTVDGVDVADHDARHERAGADEIDGDHLDIDFTPSNYTPATTPAEAAHVDDLAAHLHGIDQELTGGITGYGYSPKAHSSVWSDDASKASQYITVTSYGCPTGTKAVHVRFRVRRGSVAGDAAAEIRYGGNAALRAEAEEYGGEDNVSGIVNCDSSYRIYFYGTSSVNTFITIVITGYFV